MKKHHEKKHSFFLVLVIATVFATSFPYNARSAVGMSFRNTTVTAMGGLGFFSSESMAGIAIPMRLAFDHFINSEIAASASFMLENASGTEISSPQFAIKYYFIGSTYQKNIYADELKVKMPGWNMYASGGFAYVNVLGLIDSSGNSTSTSGFGLSTGLGIERSIFQVFRINAEAGFMTVVSSSIMYNMHLFLGATYYMPF